MYGSAYVWCLVGAASLVAATNAQAQSTSSCQAKAGEERPWLNRSYSPECRARLVLASLGSLEEKLAVLTAAGFEGNSAWLTQRGLPALSGGDGPVGIRNAGVAATSFPTPMSMAASFDRDTATLYGATVGREFFDYGHNRMGGPALDVARTWNFGRVTESLGEDPFLIQILAGHEVNAIQSQHVLSMTKHYAVYTQEQNRGGDHPLRTKPAVNAIVSERAIREIYLPGFEGAVKDGGAGQIMCSFPRINGTYACEHAGLLDILKKEWGFDGMVVPDYPDAQRSIIAAVNAGLDSGIMVSSPPSAENNANSLATQTDNTLNGEDLRVAVKEGKVSAARIDDMILRRLVPPFRIGAFDNPAKRIAVDVSTPERRATAVELITRGAVLLKNEREILPLGDTVRSVAIIGTQAGPGASVAEGGSAHVPPAHLAPVLPAVRDRAGGDVRISYAPGTLGLDRLPLIPTGMVRSSTGEAGFKAEYFANAQLDFSGTPFFTRYEAAINNTEIPTFPGIPPNRAWSARWTGRFTPLEDGVQHFTLAGSGTASFYIDGKLIGKYSNADFADTVFANLPMKADQPVDLRVEWTPRVTFRVVAVDANGTTIGPALRLGWSGPNRLIDEAAAAAKQADVAIVFVGHKVGEGMDRASLDLPNDQNALIEAVAAANPNTVVVLQIGGAISMPWLTRVRGVLQMWLPGDAFGPAAAKLLFGDAEPGGRLPITFPKDETQGPAREPRQYPGLLSATGAVDDAHFDEGLLVGYRYWDAHAQTPLFPFGYGLSYTTFDMALKSARAEGDGALVEVSVRNTGARAGAAVVQVYVGFPRTAGEPPKQLKGFEKLLLRPGEERTVLVRLDARSFQYWNEKTDRWTRDGGTYRIMVGHSSRDILGTAELRLTSQR